MMIFKKKYHHPLSGRKTCRFKQTKDCVAAVPMMASIVFGSLLRQVWPPLVYVVVRTSDFLRKVRTKSVGIFGEFFDNTGCLHNKAHSHKYPTG